MRFRSSSLSFGFGLLVGSLAIIFYNFISNNDQTICGSLASCNSSSTSIHPIKCLIEGTRKLSCLKDVWDVYLPFNRFIQKQFDVYGRIIDEDGKNERFEYFTSSSKSKRPDIQNYSSTGVFGNFGSFNVEKRERVKCMSGQNGLPMSCQWQSTPYFYPVQISQFGLQHYSRLITESKPVIKEIGFEAISTQSSINPSNDIITLKESNDFVIIKLLPDIDLTIVKFQWVPLYHTSLFIFIVQDAETGQTFTVNYVFSDTAECVWSTRDYDNNSKNASSDYFYSLGIFNKQSTYSTIIRDINTDILKALALNLPTPLKKDLLVGNTQTGQYKVLSMTFRGSAQIKMPVHQKSSAHREFLLQTADWLVQTQSNNGGWPVPVSREVSGISKILKAGWLSAMGQGHGLSVLVRAYNLTSDKRYADAATNALQPFETEAIDRGVRNHFLGMPWYEEYPTSPPSLVLNGFVYSLIGLYDLSCTNLESALRAKQLFEAGLESLQILLPLYDTGRGSTYDLKHATVKIKPNLARPDYHKAHVYLLKWLYIITGEELYKTFSNRWYLYSIGDHAKNNG